MSSRNFTPDCGLANVLAQGPALTGAVRTVDNCGRMQNRPLLQVQRAVGFLTGARILMRRPLLVPMAVLLWTRRRSGRLRMRRVRRRYPSRPAPPADTAYPAVLDRYCVTCHNERAKTGGLTLESIARASIPEHADVWEKAVRKLRAGMMPPPGMPQPDTDVRQGLIAWLETALDRAAAAKPNPGRPALHRLNRAEYANAIRDLLAVDIDVSSLLPADDSSFGFDNVADVLGVSPVLLERYLSAAEKISALAIGDASIVPGDETYRVRYDLTQTQHIEGLPLGTRGGVLISQTFPLDGEYVIKPKLWRTNVGLHPRPGASAPGRDHDRRGARPPGHHRRRRTTTRRR